MNSLRPRRQKSLFAVAACAALLAGFAALGVSQEQPSATSAPKVAAASAKPAPAGASESTFEGIDRCRLCHKQSPISVDEELDPLLKRDLCSLTEITTHRSEDKHARAFELVNTELGLKMLRRLGLIEENVTTLGVAEVKKARACFGCHSGWTHGDEPPKFFEMGVTCESCHGGAARWIDPHYKDTRWRALDADKKAALGFVDVRQPTRRIRQCLSCHLGDVDEGKVVTHEMYAAGHPPLPGFEAETFTDAMPSHWRLVKEKGEFEQRDAYLKANPSLATQLDPDDLPRTRAALIGGVVALRESLRLIADQANSQRDDVWPEFASFDCQACHHDLKDPPARAQRKGAAPGRPRLLQWPTALLRAGLRVSAPEAKFAGEVDEWEVKVASLHGAFKTAVFGDSKKLAEIVYGTGAEPDKIKANGALAWLDAKAAALAAAKIDSAAALVALRELTTIDKDNPPDFHSARQIAWAIRTIHAEQGTTYPSLSTRTPNESQSALAARTALDLKAFETLRSTTRPEAFSATDRELGLTFASDLSPGGGAFGQLLLKLPSGQKDKDKITVTENQGRFLDAIARFNADQFQQDLKTLSEKLPPAKNGLKESK